MLIFTFGHVLPMFVREVTLFGCDRELSFAPGLCAPDSANALGLLGALDMGSLRIWHFREDPTQWKLFLLLRCDSAF